MSTLVITVRLPSLGYGAGATELVVLRLLRSKLEPYKLVLR